MISPAIESKKLLRGGHLSTNSTFPTMSIMNGILMHLQAGSCAIELSTMIAFIPGSIS